MLVAQIMYRRPSDSLAGKTTHMSRLMKALLLALITLSAGSCSAFADWREDIGVFRVGIYTGQQPAGFLARSEPFRLALQEAIGMEVEFFPASRTEALIDALQTDRIEYALLSASAYALAWNVCECVEPLVVPRAGDSTDGFHTIMIVRQDGPKSLNDLAGKTVGELSPGSISQGLVAKKLLEDAGVELEKVTFAHAGSGEATLKAFLEGNYDALVGWSTMTGIASDGYSRGTLTSMAALGPDMLSGYRVLAKSMQIPHRPHVIRKKLPGELKDILRSTLGAMYDQNAIAYDSIEPTYGGGFGTARHHRFELLMDVLSGLAPQEEKLDPETVSTIGDEAEPETQNPPE